MEKRKWAICYRTWLVGWLPKKALKLLSFYPSICAPKHAFVFVSLSHGINYWNWKKDPKHLHISAYHLPYKSWTLRLIEQSYLRKKISRFTLVLGLVLKIIFMFMGLNPHKRLINKSFSCFLVLSFFLKKNHVVSGFTDKRVVFLSFLNVHRVKTPYIWQ